KTSFVTNKAFCQVELSGYCFTLLVLRSHSAIGNVGVEVWKAIKSNTNIRRSLRTKTWEAEMPGTYLVWSHLGDEVPEMGTTVFFNQFSPTSPVLFKLFQLTRGNKVTQVTGNHVLSP